MNHSKFENYLTKIFPGPGHRLGGETSSSSGVRAQTRPGPSSSSAAPTTSTSQPRSDDPEEIRRRRMAFLDKLQKSPPSNQ